MRRDVKFDAEGVTLRGWFYAPDRGRGPWPVVVMAHGFSAVKEMYLDHYAEASAQAGLAVLVYDNRNFGTSGGEPRQEIDPWAQVRDYRHAITYAQALPDVDPNRMAVWGSSYSGGHVLVVGATNRRVKCVVSQVPLVSGRENFLRLVRSDLVAATREMFAQDRTNRYRGGEPAKIAVVSEDPARTPCALPPADSHQWFTDTARNRTPSWKNEVTLRSVEMLSVYEPGTYVPWTAPTSLLMVVAVGDHLTPADLALAAYARALEPKKLALLPGGHFDAYVKDFDRAAGAARDWFVEHLGA